jgi:hypothetical protein
MDDLGYLAAKLERLRDDATDCDLIGRLATDRKKRDLFRRLAVDLRALAQDIEDMIAVQQHAPGRDLPSAQVLPASRE